MKSERAVVIGVGGIGKFLLSALVRFMAHDTKRQWELTLVDGDEYEVKNASRQAFTRLGNKAEVTADELRVQYPDLLIQAVSAFVASADQPVHEDHSRLVVPISDVAKEGDWVFCCVDNHATRLLVSQHAQTLQNVRLICGGNDYQDGNVQVAVRRNGKDLFPPIETHHPEIAHPGDKPPFAMSCEELAQAGSPQLIFANQFAATLMCAAFWAELNRSLKANEVYFDLAASALGGPAAKPVCRK